ncbi:hypothetical protein Mic7113_5307 [Allocoleopsis franciscana PCC 7113]|uniref:Uncharacterized protein n=1 Tax=Allocoleopsis franciscana PCC 7113 TaxID=1173027 RepID=K9WMC6_9CYAN|nr:hypothetical protein Mic7113_5307 [Allocoleopsis franciscana PCC 7113]
MIATSLLSYRFLSPSRKRSGGAGALGSRGAGERGRWGAGERGSGAEAKREHGRGQGDWLGDASGVGGKEGLIEGV